MERVAIVAARRTAIGTFGGMFAEVSAVKLGIAALSAALEDARLTPADLDEVIAGNILSAGLGQNVARQIGIGAGTPNEVPAYTVNKLCGSGLKAVDLGAGSIRLDDARIIAAGGTENMTRSPYIVPSARYGARMGNAELVDTMIHDALTDTFNDYHMGVTAENLADRWKISREEMDLFAAESQNRAERAMEAGRFADEIVAVEVPQRRGEPIVADTDEHPRRGVTAEALGKLRPAFRKDGRVTAGNSSGINDGACFVILASESAVAERNLTPLAWVVAAGSAAVDPAYMGYGPVPATTKALGKAGWRLADVELAELNEAFAAQSLAVLKGFEQELGGIDPAIVNVNGGAIALGHPVGASGARILVTLLHEMARRDVHKGLATLCIGGGQGIAMLVER
ncbi:MAG: acetyl-CoA C-acetyltransferase [Spirochaetota bacterium]